MTNPWLGIALVLAVHGGLMGAIYAVPRFVRLPGEVMRKLVHLSTTSVCLSFPWVFADPWPAFVYAAAATLVMGLARIPALQGLVASFGVGESLRREALGEFYYPPVIACLFLAARGDTACYVVPLVAIGFGDAAAAVVGKAGGMLRYRTADMETKSVEGSLAFLVVAFAGGWPALAAWSGLSAGEAGLVALTVATCMSMLEAVAGHGLDNITSPFGGFLLLLVLVPAPAGVQLFHASLAAAAGILLTACLTHPCRRTA